MNAVVGVNPEKILVIRSVVNFAQRQSVRNGGNSPDVSIGNDVSCVEEHRMVQAANRASALVCLYDLCAEQWLVDSPLDLAGDVAFFDFPNTDFKLCAHRRIDGDRDIEFSKIRVDDVSPYKRHINVW